MSEEPQTLEQSFDELDEILSAMEQDDVTIEDAFSQYEKGMKLVKNMHERLSSLESKVEMIAKDGNFEEFGDEI